MVQRPFIVIRSFGKLIFDQFFSDKGCPGEFFFGKLFFKCQPASGQIMRLVLFAATLLRPWRR